MTVAATVGSRRRVSSIEKRLHDSGDPATGWSRDVEGAASEIAFAKWAQMYWDASVNKFTGGDVGDIQVRSTRPPDDKKCSLLLYPKRRGSKEDKDEDIFVLVVGREGVYYICGWCRGVDGKKPEYLQSYKGRPPSWFVPVEELQPMETLVEAMSELQTAGTD